MNAEPTDLTITVEEPEACARRLTITVPAERVEDEREQVARQLAQNVTLPGFRKGKVPPKIIERKYGPAVRQEAVQEVVGEAYQQALRQRSLQPITQAEVGEIDYQPGTDLTFQAEFEVQPEPELERIGGFQVERELPAVTEDEVDQVLERLRQEHAVWEPIEESEPESGDRVEVEMMPVEADGGAEQPEPQQYELVLGEGQALPDVEQAIQRLRPGEEETFTIALAGEEAEEGDAGEQRVRLRLLEATRPDLPPLDDEFAHSLGEFDDLEELRARVSVDLEEEAESDAERAVRGQLIDQIIEANPFAVPDTMVDQYLEQVLRMPEDADPARAEEARQSARPTAERALKRMLILERVAEREGIEATSEDVDERVERIAEHHDRSPGEVWSQLQQSGRLEELEEEVRNERVFEYLESQSTIT